MKLCRKVGAFLFLSAAAICLTIGTANAQEITQYAFTLQHATQWGKHVLPKGTYNCTVSQTNDMTAATVAVNGTSNSFRQIQMVGLGRVPETLLKGTGSVLVVSHFGDTSVLRGIYLTDQRVEYTFPVHVKAGSLMVKDSQPAPEREIALRTPVRGASK